MHKSITLLRHAETTANAAGLWQGSIDTPFSDRGRRQLDQLAARINPAGFDVAVSSDIPRARETAVALGLDFDVDAAWREGSIGNWEGLAFVDTLRDHPDVFAAMARGEDVAFGDGERLSEVAARTVPALLGVADRIPEGGSGVVVSHGLALLTAVTAVFGLARPARLQLLRNTAMATLVISEWGMHMASYNEAPHLGEPLSRRDGDTHVVVFRHGRTKANDESRWQGHGDWPLNELGEAQAAAVAKEAPPLDALYTSPLLRAKATADAIAEAQGFEVEVDERLKEIGFGAWENRTREEIIALDPQGWERFRGGEDIARGGSGERFVDVQRRMTEAIDEIVHRHHGQRVGIVSHGGATRSYVTGLLGLEFPNHHRVFTMDNTGYATLVYGERGAMVGEWNVMDHIRGLG